MEGEMDGTYPVKVRACEWCSPLLRTAWGGVTTAGTCASYACGREGPKAYGQYDRSEVDILSWFCAPSCRGEAYKDGQVSKAQQY